LARNNAPKSGFREESRPQSRVVAGSTRSVPGMRRPWDAASGTFYWEPAPGFLGRYRIVFSNGSQRISVRVVVVP